MSAQNVEQKRAQATMQFLRTTFNPIVNNTAPPIVTSSRSDILKDVTIQCQLTIPSTAPINEGVPNQSGMILWLMKRGLTSLYRMAFVPAGAVSNISTSGPHGLVTTNLNLTIYNATGGYGTPGYLAPDGYGIVSTITYAQELALPVGSNNGVNNIIQINPSTTTIIKYARVYAGIFEAYSSTVSIGNTALSGTFSAASISDTRDICQTSQGAFSITNIIQASESTKDAVMQIPSDQGVLTLMGPDVQDTFTNPNQEQAIVCNGTFKVYPIPIAPISFYPSEAIYAPAQTPPAVPPLRPYSNPLCNIWVTPWATSVTTRIVTSAAAAAPSLPFPITSASVTTIKIDQIAEIGIPWFRFGAVAFVNPSRTTPPNASDVAYEINVAACHIFATANLDGTIQYNTFIERKLIFYGSQYTWVAGSIPISLEFHPELFFTSFTATGKYIGTLITPFVDDLIGENGEAGNFAVILQNMVISVVDTDIQTDGVCGPARIIRWDAMSQGMTLDIAGKLWAQVIPSSTLMPYVKVQEMNRTRYVPENAERFVKRVYNSSGTVLRRVWNLKAYKEFLAGAAKDISTETVFDWSRRDEDIEEAAYAAGMFSTSKIRLRDD